MKKFIIQVIFLIIIIGVALFIYKTNTQLPDLPFLPQPLVQKQVQISNANIKVEVADTQAKRSKGLGGKTSLGQDEGMLFVFEKLDKYPFWMKGLTFPLDFIWIRGDKVVDILVNVQPPAAGQSDASLPIYQSSETVDKVLEATAGTIQKYNIKVGDTVRIE